ncbi:hypothetical protein [Streptomyces incanus]|uniref:Uncharacterized protein n=1 Tax=Streptomyces incanus TaxID=887453 RepID=A0ABW0XT60_9ACTN
MALVFFTLDVDADIWRRSVGSDSLVATVLFLGQALMLKESPTGPAGKGRLDESVADLDSIYGIKAIAGMPDEATRTAVEVPAVGFRHTDRPYW